MNQLIYEKNKELKLMIERKINWIMTDENKPEFIILCQAIPILEGKIKALKIKAWILPE